MATNPECLHTKKGDLTSGLGRLGRHYYCPECGWHNWQGRDWTRDEWEDHVNIDQETGEDYRKRSVEKVVVEEDFPF